MFCGQEIGNMSSFGAPSEISSSTSLSVKTVARNDSPPWREDDKDGHYMFELGDDLTPRCNTHFSITKQKKKTVFFFLIILELPFKYLLDLSFSVFEQTLGGVLVI